MSRCHFREADGPFSRAPVAAYPNGRGIPIGHKQGHKAATKEGRLGRLGVGISIGITGAAEAYTAVRPKGRNGHVVRHRKEVSAT